LIQVIPGVVKPAAHGIGYHQADVRLEQEQGVSGPGRTLEGVLAGGDLSRTDPSPEGMGGTHMDPEQGGLQGMGGFIFLTRPACPAGLVRGLRAGRSQDTKRLTQ
jgi:hypothetical protein